MLLEPACFLCVALPRRGHFFAAQSAKKRSPLCPQKREFVLVSGEAASTADAILSRNSYLTARFLRGIKRGAG